MKNRPFENFDFTDFWDDDEYAMNEYIGAPPTEEMIEETECELGYKLPESYIWLMKQHNGGIPFNVCFPCDEPTVGRTIMWLSPALWELIRIRYILFADSSAAVS